MQSVGSVGVLDEDGVQVDVPVLSNASNVCMCIAIYLSLLLTYIDSLFL